MLIDKDIEIHITCQQLECSRFDIEEDRSVLLFRSNRKSGEVVFPFCGGRVHVHGRAITTLKDMPLWFGTPLDLEVEHHRYRCTCCGGSFGEDVCMRYPGTRITYRAARWVQELLRWRLPISAVHEITGFHRDTIRRIHESAMQEALDWRRKELRDKDYKPRYLAVDEFALHQMEDEDSEVTIMLNSPGGSVQVGFMLIDTIRSLKCDVEIIVMGLAASMGAVMLMSGTKGKKKALPHAGIRL